MNALNIGGATLDNPIFLAPMAGVTDLPFRRVCRSLGAGMVVAEMTTADLRLVNTRKSFYRRIHRDEPAPRSIQLVGWHPQTLAQAARYNVDQGASIIDINMGCPAKKVCNRLSGSALLENELLVAEILRSVVNAVDVPVTLKIRTGTSPERKNGIEIARIAEQEGVSLLAVHGRTRADKFKGHAEYDTIRDIKSAVSIPVIANGDINSLEKARKVLAYTHADGLMIGRGAYGAPWFPGCLANALNPANRFTLPALATQRKIALRHLYFVHEFYGIEQGVRIARKHIKWYTEKFPRSAEWRSKINPITCAKQQLSMLSDYYLKLSDENFDYVSAQTS